MKSYSFLKLLYLFDCKKQEFLNYKRSTVTKPNRSLIYID